MPSRYESYFGDPVEPGIGEYIVAGLEKRQANQREDKKNMATLIAQLAQVGMIKPAKKAGPNTLPAYGKHWEVVTTPESLQDMRTQQIIDQQRKETGEIPMTKYEIANEAKNNYLDYLESEEWARTKWTIEEDYKNDPEGMARAMAAAQKEVYDNQYNTLYDMQRQFFPDAFKDAESKSGGSIKTPPPIDAAGNFIKEEDQKGYLQDIASTGTNIAKLAATTAGGVAVLKPGAITGIATGAAKGAKSLAKSMYPFAKAAFTGKAPLTPATIQTSVNAGRAGATRALLGAPTVASRMGAAVNPVLRGYVGGKILGNVAATLTPQDQLRQMGGVVQGNPALRAFAHPMRYMTNPMYRQGNPMGMPGYQPNPQYPGAGAPINPGY
jgi:hypothetical protein